jgi:microsomal epoxide hydrolase
VVPAIHLNLCRTVLPGPDATAPLKDYWAKVGKVMASESAYQQLHQTRPQTIGLALHDNPVGWAAWVIEKFQRWSDSNGNIESRFTKGQLITNLMTYLTTDSVMSSIWFYYGNTRESKLPLPLKVPTGLAAYPGEFLPVPDRDLAQLAYNVEHYATMAAGGHFAAMEVPDIFAADILAFFTPRAGKTISA